MLGILLPNIQVHVIMLKQMLNNIEIPKELSFSGILYLNASMNSHLKRSYHLCAHSKKSWR